MAEPFIGEIRLMPYTFAPRNWAFCTGQVLPVSQNFDLFRVLGAAFGGNGTTDFCLPNLIGRVAMGAGAGTGLTPRALGGHGGAATVTLTADQVGSHTHALQAFDNPLAKANVSQPANNVVFARATDTAPYQATVSQGMVKMAAGVVAPTQGGSQPHNNMQPYVVLNYCIALSGIDPPHA